MTLAARSAELGLGEPGSREVEDVVSCPGTDSCKLGITSSMGVNQALAERLQSMAIKRPARARDPHQDLRLPERLRQHHVGAIGFYGASIKVGEHAIPAYIPHAGGNFEGDEVRFGDASSCACPPSAYPRLSSAGSVTTKATRGRRGPGRSYVERVGTANARERKSRISRCLSTSVSRR